MDNWKFVIADKPLRFIRSKNKCQHVSGSMYIVYNQNGYRRALRKEGWTKDNAFDVLGSPSHYPSLVSITYVDAMGHFEVDAVTLKALIEHLEIGEQ